MSGIEKLRINPSATTIVGDLSVTGTVRGGVLQLVNSNLSTQAALTTTNGDFLTIEAFNGGNTVKKPVSLCPYGGNVGIGTTSPQALLDVNGNINLSWQGLSGYIGSYIYSSGDYFLGMKVDRNSRITYIDSQAPDLNGGIQLRTGGQISLRSRLEIDPYGKVGIGCSSWCKVGIGGGSSFNNNTPFNPPAWNLNASGVLISGSTIHGSNTNGMFVGFNDAPSYGMLVSIEPGVAWRPIYISASSTTMINASVNCAYTTASGWVNASDEREKEDILPIKTHRSLERILALRPVHFKRKFYDKDNIVPEEEKQRRLIGFLAQEVNESNPHCLSTWINEEGKTQEDNGERFGLCYNDYIVHLVGAFQEQQKIISSQSTKIAELETILARHEEMLQQLSTGPIGPTGSTEPIGPTGDNQ